MSRLGYGANRSLNKYLKIILLLSLKIIHKRPKIGAINMPSILHVSQSGGEIYIYLLFNEISFSFSFIKKPARDDLYGKIGFVRKIGLVPGPENYHKFFMRLIQYMQPPNKMTKYAIGVTFLILKEV